MKILIICGSKFEFKRRTKLLIKAIPWYKRIFISIKINESKNYFIIGNKTYTRVYHTDDIRGVRASSYLIWNEDIILKNQDELILACRFACLDI